MQKIAAYEMVAKACEQLSANGEKITGRSVLAITGGSLGTVLAHIKEWRAAGERGSTSAAAEIPKDLQVAVLRALSLVRAETKSQLKEEIEQAATREAEYLEGLASAEARIEELTTELNAVRTATEQARQDAEKAKAVATEKIVSLEKRVMELETERRQLIDAAEKSRTESAKAQLQVERADQATAKAESRVKNLETHLTEITDGKIVAEKAQAVAHQKAADQAEALSELKAVLAELKAESREVVGEYKREIATLREEKTALEKQLTGFLAEQTGIAII